MASTLDVVEIVLGVKDYKVYPTVVKGIVQLVLPGFIDHRGVVKVILIGGKIFFVDIPFFSVFLVVSHCPIDGDTQRFNRCNGVLEIWPVRGDSTLNNHVTGVNYKLRIMHKEGIDHVVVYRRVSYSIYVGPGVTVSNEVVFGLSTA